MTTETRRSAWIALGQVALVLLSVGLGFGLAEWRQARADTARTELAVRGAVRELEANRERVQQALGYHETLFDSLDTGATTRLELRPAPLVDTSWETMQASGVAADLPYAVAEALAGVHEMQTTYQEIARMNLGLLYFGNVFGSDRLPSDARGYAPSISDLRYFEHELLRLYDDALGALDGAGFDVET